MILQDSRADTWAVCGHPGNTGQYYTAHLFDIMQFLLFYYAIMLFLNLEVVLILPMATVSICMVGGVEPQGLAEVIKCWTALWNVTKERFSSPGTFGGLPTSSRNDLRHTQEPSLNALQQTRYTVLLDYIKRQILEQVREEVTSGSKATLTHLKL